ncbi:DUF4270 domain-containing protein [Flavobacteriaceae bacterium LMO-SS05]
MKNKHTVLKNFAVLSLLISSFIACDKDFASLDSDIINNDNATHFNTSSLKFNVTTYNKKLDPIQTNNLPINYLGVYNDPVYGTTTASVVTQITPSAFNPVFGEHVALDSVVLTIPYFSKVVELKESGETIYKLDSVFGSTPIKLSIFESNYFLRDFNPALPINSPQSYFSDGSTGIDQISPAQLEGALIKEVNDFLPIEKEIQFLDSVGKIETRMAPALRLNLDTDFWLNKIINKQGAPELSNSNNFKDYFRGLYFKAEATGLEGNAMLLNFTNTNANITMYYTKDPTTVGGARISGTYVFSFNGNRVNFISEPSLIKPDGDEVNGDEKLYLKGGQGSIAIVDLFNGVIQDPDSGLDVPQLEYYKSKKGKWLINEANLVFYVDQTAVEGLKEPGRIYLYDLENKRPLLDYFSDISSNTDPSNSRIIHLGKLQRVDNEPNGKGIRYKIKITDHLKNILLNDSTNVKLGLAVSTNVNIESNARQFNVLTDNALANKVPLSSIITPRGTVLYGNKTTNEEKKVSLEVFYTEPKSN